MRRTSYGWLPALAMAMAAALAGCGSDLESTVSERRGSPPVTRYDLANRCFVLKADDAYVVRDGNSFVASGSTADGAERFYMKPAGLGRYLFYTADKRLMTGSGSAVAAAARAADGSDWTLEGNASGYRARTLGKALAVNAQRRLLLGDAPAALRFEVATGCVVYPEMPVGIQGETFKNSRGGPVLGFAEVHAHMSMGSEMSDGSGNVGPSAGGVMYGQAIHRFGVPHALEDCERMHGPDGTLSPENIILDQNPTATHDTVGWPTFIGWPEHDSQLHQQMYYRWVERAYRAGLRTMVVHGTNIEALCEIAKQTGNDKDTDLNDTDCTDMGVGVKQVQYLYDIEAYVDAQEGGPGKGWFRIVKDPSEARAVIAAGKLAVIPGLEFSNIFRCNVTFNPDGSETHGCTREDIDRQIDEVWELGVRAVFPYHDVDSALGGAGIFSSALNYVNFAGTRAFWKTYPCEDGGEGPSYFYTAGAVMESSSLTRFNDPISQVLVNLAQGRLPLYGPGRQCNARTVTDLGKYAIAQIMRKGFTIDIDHAEIRSKQYMLDEAAKLSPNYPMISGHGGHGGISVAQATQIIRQGGIIYPALPNGKDFVAFLNKLEPIWTNARPDRPLAVGYGADANGLRNLPGPRGAGSEPIRYPFTLFTGDGWDSQMFKNVAPLHVEMLSIPGGQSWNMDEVGMANYGLVADIVEEIRIEGGSKATSALYRSAEAYLQLWEQTLAASADARRKLNP